MVWWVVFVWLCQGVPVVFAKPEMVTLAQRKPAVTMKRVKPSQAFHVAYQDYVKGYYDLALSEFQQFVEEFPKSSLAAAAYYYMSECYDQQGNLKKTARALSTLVNQYLTSRHVPAALFKLGKVMEKAGYPRKAEAYWRKLIKDFRWSPEARLASHRLKRIP